MVTKLQYSPYINENIDETSYWCNDIWKKENIKSKCKSRGGKIENSLSHSTRFRHVTQLQLITGKDGIHNRVLSRKLLSFRARWCVQVHGGNVKPIKFELHQNGGEIVSWPLSHRAENDHKAENDWQTSSTCHQHRKTMNI